MKVKYGKKEKIIDVNEGDMLVLVYKDGKRKHAVVEIEPIFRELVTNESNELVPTADTLCTDKPVEIIKLVPESN